jgi:hypothetical protein
MRYGATPFAHNVAHSMREEEQVDYEKCDNHTGKPKSEHVSDIVAGNAFSSFVS